MIYGHTVKHDGTLYAPGEKVPTSSPKVKETKTDSQPTKRGRKTKTED